MWSRPHWPCCTRCGRRNDQDVGTRQERIEGLGPEDAPEPLWDTLFRTAANSGALRPQRRKTTSDLGTDASGANDQRPTLRQLANAAVFTDEWVPIPHSVALLRDRDVELAQQKENPA